MSFRVVITDQAEREMQSAFDWWAEFTIRGDEVVLLSVRNPAQRDFLPDAISN